MAKQNKPKQKPKKATQGHHGDSKATRQAQPGDTKVMRLAHKILTQTIWTANLQLEEAIETIALVAKALVLSNTSDEDPAERSGLIDEITQHFVEVLMDIDPFADHAHLWLVPPQGLITEPFGILWDGLYEEDSVKGVLGADLTLLRTEHAEAQDKTGMIIIEGVEGVAAIVPDWDGEDTAVCANPECGRAHDVHLKVAEELFHQTIERQRQRAAAN
jgi:hypothetical protein